MEAFASREQYEIRYGKVADEAMLGECLMSATAEIMTQCAKAGVDISDPDELTAFNLMDVCRAMADRIMPTDNGGDFPQGVTQATTSAGSYSEMYTFSSTYGTPKLLASERERLGIGRQSYRSVCAGIGGRDDQG